MRIARLVVTLFVLLGIFSLGTQQQVLSQTETYTRTATYTNPSTVKAQLPSLDVIKRFVTTLIDAYNELVNQYDKSRSDFGNVKGFFTLYHDQGHSFNVTVIQTWSNRADYMSLIFNPIEASQPSVTINRTVTLQALFPNITLSQSFLYTIQRDIVVTEYNGNIVRLYAIMVMPTDTFSPSSDYIADANQIAQSMYNEDHTQIPTVSQTQTVKETLTKMTTIQSNSQNQSWMDIVWNNINAIGVVVGLLASVLYLYEKRRWVRLQIERLRNSDNHQSEQYDQGAESHNKQD